MATKYGYAESSDLKAVNAGHIYSVVDTVNTLENGMVVGLGEEVSGNPEVRQAVAPTKAGHVVLVLNPAVTYDQSTTAAAEEENYFVPAGTPARAYDLYAEDRFMVADYLITALSDNVVKGNYIVANTATRKYTEVAATGFTAADYGFYAKILDTVVKDNMTLVLVRVMKNA